MSKRDNKKLEAAATTDTTTEVVKFKSAFKNLVLAGTSIVFKEGFYETDVTDEIEILRKNNLVHEWDETEESEAGE